MATTGPVPLTGEVVVWDEFVGEAHWLDCFIFFMFGECIWREKNENFVAFTPKLRPPPPKWQRRWGVKLTQRDQGLAQSWRFNGSFWESWDWDTMQVAERKTGPGHARNPQMASRP